MVVESINKAKRRISDRNHNRYVAEGVEPHKSTKMAPSSLIQPLPDNITQRFLSKHDEVYQALIKLMGPPTYSDSGFILYQGDCCHLIPKLQAAGIQINLTVTSPPYNIGKEYESQMPINEYVKWCSQWMTQILSLIHI